EEVEVDLALALLALEVLHEHARDAQAVLPGQPALGAAPPGVAELHVGRAAARAAHVAALEIGGQARGVFERGGAEDFGRDVSARPGPRREPRRQPGQAARQARQTRQTRQTRQARRAERPALAALRARVSVVLDDLLARAARQQHLALAHL